MKKSIYFKGYYGFKNIGDDIFCITADWICNEVWNNKEAIFIGENLPEVSNKSKKMNINSYWLRKFYELYILLKCDYIIYFGGSLFSKVGGVKDIKYILGKFSRFHSKLLTIGTSVGPFKSLKDFDSIKYFLSKFKYRLVRDSSSLDILSKMDLQKNTDFSFDLAILINKVIPGLEIRGKNNKLKIAVSLCHYERYVGGNSDDEKERELAVFNYLENIIGKYDDSIEEIVFFEFNGSEDKGDLEISKEFCELLPNSVGYKIINYTTNTKEFIREFNKCDFVIGMRLHSGILAYALNIPFMLVEYHVKCTEFLNTINHHYRFDVKNQKSNMESFDNILKNTGIPNIKDPKQFEEIMLNQLTQIDKTL